MSSNDSVNFTLRLVRERHKQLRTALDSMLKTIAGENAKTKEDVARQVISAAQDLRGTISKTDIPSWLETTLIHTNQFVSKGMTTPDYLANLISFKAGADNHSWSFESLTDTPIDFDAIYEQYKKESRLPELFDEVVRILHEISDSGEIDSVMMMKALQKVIATISKCKSGSYFSLNSSWDFLWTFVKNYLWNELSAISGLGTAAAALKTAMESINEEMFSLHTKIDGEIKSTVGAEIKKLEGKTTTPFLTYNRDGYSLPDLGTRLLESQA